MNFPQRERRPPKMLFRRFTSHHNWSSLFSVSVIIAIVIIIIIIIVVQMLGCGDTAELKCLKMEMLDC